MEKTPRRAKVFSCSASDTGYMEVLERNGTAKHKQNWLTALLNSEIRSTAEGVDMPRPMKIYGHEDAPLAASRTHLCTLRLADGPDAGHRWQVACAELRRYSANRYDEYQRDNAVFPTDILG